MTDPVSAKAVPEACDQAPKQPQEPTQRRNETAVDDTARAIGVGASPTASSRGDIDVDEQEDAGAALANEHMQARLAHLDALAERGIDPYGQRFERTHLAAPTLAQWAHLQGEDRGEVVCLAGRLKTIRDKGKVAFADLIDQTGRIQIYLKKDVLGEEQFATVKLLDLGDIVGVRGPIFRTRAGDLTVSVERLDFLTKALRPPPDKHHGLRDVDTRYRERYVDLIANPDVRDVFIKRSRMVSAIRRQLDGEGFLEMETPTLLPLATGATARPFKTHHNALDLDLYMRIATELYLKRCIVGGLEKVYEIGRIFRNEGISTRHNPEFTMLELYQSYADYTDMMNITERIVTTACQEVNGSLTIRYGDYDLDLSPPFPRISMEDALRQYGGPSFDDMRDAQKARQIVNDLHLDVAPSDGVAHLMDKVFEAVVEPHLINPTFIIDYPVELSPLARRRSDNSSLTWRFELFAVHVELANAFSELNDPRDQRSRFEGQMALRASGNEEAHPVDEDFLKALEYGMPPTGGLGIGIDRLAMLLTDAQSIRDVVLFPTMKPRAVSSPRPPASTTP